MEISLEDLTNNPAAETAAAVAETSHVARCGTVEMLDVMDDVST